MRECNLTLVAGMKGVGKTVETIRLIDDYIRGNPANGAHGRKALLFDVNNEFEDFWFFNNAHRRIPAIAIADIPRFTAHPAIEVRRIRPFWDDGTRMTLDDMKTVLGIILDNYRVGLLLVEDINKYTGDALKQDLVGSLATCRHSGLDIIAHYQGIGRVANPKLLMNCKYVRFHKTIDTVDRHAKKFEENYLVFKLAEYIVNHKYESGDERFFLYIQLDKNKILGKFSNADIDKAIVSYIEDNYQKEVAPLLVKKDLNTGNLKYTNQSAVQYLKSSLYTKYFKK